MYIVRDVYFLKLYISSTLYIPSTSSLFQDLEAARSKANKVANLEDLIKKQEQEIQVFYI